MKPRRSTRRKFKAKAWALIDDEDGVVTVFSTSREAVARFRSVGERIARISVSEILPKGKKRGKR